MRLLIFSDIHGNQYAWRAFLNRVSLVEYDRMVFLGDIFGYYYGQEEIIKGLTQIKDLIWLNGNHDQFFLDLLENKADKQVLTMNYGSTYQHVYAEEAWLCRMIACHPFTYQLEADGLNILFCHGTPENPVDGRCYPRDHWRPSDCLQYDTVICGHTHWRMVRQGGGKQWINAGSLGQPRDGNESGFLLYDTETRRFEYVDVPYEKAHLFQEIQKKDPYLYKLQEVLKRRKQQ